MSVRELLFRTYGCDPAAAVGRFVQALGFAAAIVFLTLGDAQAGFAFIGWGRPVLFIPPGGPARIVPTIRPGQPPLIVSFCRNRTPCRWVIKSPSTPIWPFNNAVPLIRDNTAFLSHSPFITPAGVWGIWDPPVLSVDGEETIRVFEIFTGIDLSAPSIGTVEWGNLASVSGVTGVSVSDFPTGSDEIPQPIGLDPLVDILSSEIIGLVTEAIYPTTLIESTFADLPTTLESLAPGTPFDLLLDNFIGATGRAVISYADIPAKDVILFGSVPEPGTLLLIAAGLVLLHYCSRSPRRLMKSGENRFSDCLQPAYTEGP